MQIVALKPIFFIFLFLTTIIFAGPKRLACSFVSVDKNVVPTHSLRDKVTKGQRDKVTKGQRDKRTNGQRDKGTKGQRDKATKGQRDKRTK